MPSDYKDAIQQLAEEIAQKDFGIDYFDLPPETRQRVYELAEQTYYER